MKTPDSSGKRDQFSEYAGVIEYLYARLPMFTRVGSSAYRADLSNTIALSRNLGDPYTQFKSIHIAGTNGKGSCSHMLAAILQIAGYKTGLYTSPHLKDFRERIRINGEMISEEEVINFVKKHSGEMEKLSPSFFEMTVAMAFDHFRNHGVDIAVIETGLGGRLDSTNVICPEVSLITNIGYDHMNILGDTLPQIAAEKAGIIKPGVPVVLSQRQDEVLDVFIKRATELNSELILASDVWKIREAAEQDGKFLVLHTLANGKEATLKLDLKGLYQSFNLAGVLSTVDVLRSRGFNITDGHISVALQQVQNLTGLMGRWQRLQDKTLVIVDTGHNADGIREILKNVERTVHSRLHWVLGMVSDKDISAILQLLPKNALYYFCSPDMPRAKPAAELQNEALVAGLKGSVYPSVSFAFEAAKRAAAQDDLVLVAGSTFVVAEVI